MESNPLLPLPEGMQIDQIQTSENEVRITVIAAKSERESKIISGFWDDVEELKCFHR
jgi:hypothetical protein